MPDTNNELNVICDNIRDLSHHIDLISEQKKISFELLAEILVDTTQNSVKKDELASEYNDIVKKLDDIIPASDHMALLKVLANGTVSSHSFLSESDGNYGIFSPNGSSKISYVKNNYSDVAFMRFSKLFSKPTVSYGASFEEICEDVYNSVSDYCILPIENAANGKLFSFYALIDKYDLKIFAVCDLDEGLSGKRTRYALLSRKNFIYLEQTYHSYFEFSIIGDDSYSLSDILEAAGSCSMKLYRIDTLPTPYDDLTFRFYHIFECDKTQVLPFLMYLNYKYPQHEVIGHYISL